MIDESQVAPSIQTLIENLKGLSKEVDQGDLPALAKMHEACGKVLECAATDSDPEASRLTELTQDIVTGLEGLILGEVDDASAAMAGVIAQVSRLCA
ncbi:MAG: hypothetical protein IID43_01195, partial [Planctomycetes bacterium]|nr:hypothetical protein [Planctomycetota bacterium]